MASSGNRPKRLLMLEFNELCPSLIEKFMAEGALPNFKRLRDRSETFVTFTNEAELEPWIQWVTVHTGVPLSIHGIHDLDEAEKLECDTFWDSLHDENVLLMSPMNVKFRRNDDSVFMPDPWAASQMPSEEIEPFFKFIRSAVTGHARTDGFNARDAAGAALFLVKHGLSLDSMRGAVSQLLQERFGAQDVKWRRATILDRLLWDVFAHYWRGRAKPRVGIMFSNATAHYQHKYWAHHDPSPFVLKPDARDIEAYGNAIRFGYQAHDRLIGKALSLAGDDTAVVLCTALSQQPMLDYEARGGKAMFIPKDYTVLMKLLGVPAGFRVEGLMAEESWLHFGSEQDAADALAAVNAARTSEGRPLLKTRGFEARSFIIGCAVLAGEVGSLTQFVNARGERHSFHEQFLRMNTVTTAKHHPDGILWVADPQRQPSVANTRLPLTQVRGKLEQAFAMAA